MVKHHLTARGDHWRRRVVINGFSAFLSFTVVLIFAVAKFKEGAWLIFVVRPLLLLGLLRLHRQYALEDDILETGVAEATEAPVLHRHVVIVLVDRLDMATARALQYARTLTPDDLRAVHFDIDTKVARELEAEWGRLGLARLPLDVIECPDRRLGRAAIELVADTTLDGDTECTVLLPRRSYATVWQRFLHDRTADKIAAVLGQLPHVSATIVPFAGRWPLRRAGALLRPLGAAGAPPAVRRDGSAKVDTDGPPGSTRGPEGRAPAAGGGDGRRFDVGPAGWGDHPDRRGGVASPRPDCWPGQVGADPATGRHLEPRVCPGRR